MGIRSRILGAAQIGDNVTLGSRTNILGPNVIGNDVTIGSLTTVLPGAFIGDNTELGDREVRLEELAGVPVQDGDAITRPDPSPEETRSQSLHVVRDRSIGELAT